MTPGGRMALPGGSPRYFLPSQFGAQLPKKHGNRSAADNPAQSGTVDKHRTLSKQSRNTDLTPRARGSEHSSRKRRRSAGAGRHEDSRDLLVRVPCCVRASESTKIVPYVLGVCFYLPPAQPPLLSSTRSIEYLIEKHDGTICAISGSSRVTSAFN